MILYCVMDIATSFCYHFVSTSQQLARNWVKAQTRPIDYRIGEQRVEFKRMVYAIMRKVRPGVYKRMWVGDNEHGMAHIKLPEAIAVHGIDNIHVIEYLGC